MQLNDIVIDTAKHIAKMSQNPATVDHARWRLKELMQDQSGLFVNIKELTLKEIEKCKQSNKSLGA